MLLSQAFPNASGHDFDLYFKGSWILCSHKTAWRGWQWKYVRNIEEGRPSVIALGDTKRAEYVITEKELQCDFTPLHSGYYPFRKSAVLLWRKPVQSATKGLNLATIRLLDPFAASSEYMRRRERVKVPEWYRPLCDGIHEDRMTEEILGEILNDPRGMEQLPDALRILEKGFVASMLTRGTAVSIGIWSENPTLWFFERPVGEVLSSKRVVVYDKLFVVEVIDTLSPQGIRVEFSREKENSFVCQPKDQ